VDGVWRHERQEEFAEDVVHAAQAVPVAVVPVQDVK
jgi:hypothetical protein